MTRLCWRDLLKISSKIKSPEILIFYFGLIGPTIGTLEDLMKTPLEIHGKEKWKMNVMYEFSTVGEAKKCIMQSKAAYKCFKEKLKLLGTS